MGMSWCDAELMRDQDRPPYDGSVTRLVLSALGEARTIGEVALYLQWDWERAHMWVHRLRRLRRVERVGWTRTPKGRWAGRYVKVDE